MTGYKAQKGNQVEGSGPLGLVLLSYESLYKSLAHTCRAIEAGDLAAEADHTSRAMEGMLELSANVNVEQGGEVASNLIALYAYMMKRLSEDMCTCSTATVEEVMGLVHTLREGWQQLQRDQQRNKTAQIPQAKSTSAPQVKMQHAAYAAQYIKHFKLPTSAIQRCFATRQSLQVMAVAIGKSCNVVTEHLCIAQRVCLSSLMVALGLLQRATAICYETCLAMRDDRPTDAGNLKWLMYSFP